MPRRVTSNFFGQLFGFVGGGWTSSGPVESSPPFVAAPSDAGAVVTAQSALNLAPAWACIRLLSETIGSLPVKLVKPDSHGVLQPATRDPRYRVLTRSPNSRMTSLELYEYIVASLNLWGNAYCYIARRDGAVSSLIPLRPEAMTVLNPTNGAQLIYRYQYQGKETDYQARDILHVRGFGVDGLVGISPISVARQTLGRAVTTDEASGSVFKNGLSAGGFISYDGAFPTKEQRDQVREQIAGFTGSKETGKVMVLEHGMTYKGLTMQPADAQLLESRYFNTEEICRWFRVPPQLIGHTDKSSSWASALENVTLWFLKSALRPLMVRITQSISRSLQIPDDWRLEFDYEELLRGDTIAQQKYFASVLQNGIQSRAEVRRRLGLPYIEGSDTLTVQSNLIPLDKIEEMGGQAVTEANGGNDK